MIVYNKLQQKTQECILKNGLCFQILFAVHKNLSKNVMLTQEDQVTDRLVLQICSVTRKYPFQTNSDRCLDDSILLLSFSSAIIPQLVHYVEESE